MPNLITHYGFNRTDFGHYMKPGGWIPVEQSPEGPVCVWRDVYGRVQRCRKLAEWLEHLIEHQQRLCRIWVRYADGTTKCVYWYEQNQLDYEAIRSY